MLRTAAALLAVSLPIGLGSAGDRDPLFRECVARTGDGQSCMLAVSRSRLSQGLPLLQ